MERWLCNVFPSNQFSPPFFNRSVLFLLFFFRCMIERIDQIWRNIPRRWPKKPNLLRTAAHTATRCCRCCRKNAVPLVLWCCASHSLVPVCGWAEQRPRTPSSPLVRIRTIFIRTFLYLWILRLMWGFLLVRQTEVVSDPKTVPGIVMDPKTVRSLFKIRLLAIFLRLMGWTTLSVLIMHVNPVMSEQNVETRILTVFPHLDCSSPSVF